ncbi:MAG TPA: IS630 family transposase [Solirubrobacteraceae bacterium]|nr:IS630 family transposase [Solirubrobacteraceae bacterium]
MASLSFPRHLKETCSSIDLEGDPFANQGGGRGRPAFCVGGLCLAWIQRYRRGGWKALAKRRRGRRPGEQEALSAAQQARIVEAIRSKNPDQLRIEALLWTRSSVQDLIERWCGVRLEVGTVGRYLRRWGFTLKRPTRWALEADPVLVEAWLSDVYPKIRAKARKDGGIILWQDESGLRLDRLVAKQGYAPRGQRAIAPSTGNRQGINMISALANSGELRFQIFEGRFTARVFIEFLDRLIRSIPDRKIHLICDNHTTHHAKAVKRWVAEHADRIQLHFLPAHSPELDPDEQLNQDVKRHMCEVDPKPIDKATLRSERRGSCAAASVNRRSCAPTSRKRQSATPPPDQDPFAARRDTSSWAGCGSDLASRLTPQTLPNP